jgi:hypothetical protein
MATRIDLVTVASYQTIRWKEGRPAWAAFVKRLGK